MVVLGTADIVSSEVANLGRWEIAVADDMATKVGTSLPETGTFLDIGANIGYYTLLFAHRGFNVIAVEAMTRNQQAINASLCLNPQLRDRITLVPTALVAPWEVGTTTCIIKSTNYKINIGNGHLLCGPTQRCESGDGNCQAVAVKTLDKVLADVAPTSVDVMKMDVETYECHVLAGGDTLFSRYHPKLLQVETAFLNTSKCVHAKAEEYGYREKVLGGDTSLILDAMKTPPSKQVDLPTFLPLPTRAPPGGNLFLDKAKCVPDGMRVARVSAGFNMVVLGTADIVSSEVANLGRWEIAVADDMATKVGTSLPKTGTFLDIGANIGYYTLLFAHRGFNVIAVEAMTRNQQAINASLCLNPQLRDRITLVPTALVAPWEVGTTTCIIKSTNYKINIGNGHLLCGPTQRCESGDGNCQAVAVKTLDKVLADVAPTSVDVMKMDVETYECHVLAGGDTLFSRYHPKLLQVETAFLNTSKCVHAKAEEYGYREKVLGGDTSLILDAMKTPPSKQVDLPTFLPLPTRAPPGGNLFLDKAKCVPAGMRVARVSAGFNMVVLGTADIVSSEVANLGRWEIAVADDMATKVGTSLPETGTFLDIGANIGYYTLLFAHRGFNVIAVEAMTRNQQAINASLCLNPQLRDRITLVPTALVAPWEVGTTTCIIKSTNYKINIGNGHLLCGPTQRCESGDGNCQAVAVKTLDKVLADVAPTSVDVMKMDVETYECHVLAGGDTLFSRYHPKLLQVETAFLNTSKCVHAKAEEYGYREKVLGGDTSLILDAMKTPPSKQVDLPTFLPLPTRAPPGGNLFLDKAKCVPAGMRVARVSAGFNMVVLGTADIVSSEVANLGRWEIAVADDMATKVGTSLPETGTFLDIGANIGYYTLLFAHRGFNVIAVEAMTRNQQAINASLCLNPQLRDRITLVPTALVAPWEVGTTTCIIKSTNYKINIGNGHLLCGPTQRCESGDGNCQAVAVKTLDKVLADVAPTSVDVMKMDVETYECHVLAGGDTLFSRYHPKLLQVETAFLNTSKCVHAKAEEYGYREKVLGGDTSLILDAMKTPPSKQVDLPTFLPLPTRAPPGGNLFLDKAKCVPAGMRVARVSAGFNMVVLGTADIVSSEVANLGRWEIAVADDMATKVGTSLPETGTFLDIGANIGYYTLLFAHRGFNVIAVEAMTRNQQAINASLCLNPQLRDRITLVPTALVAPWEVGTTTCIIKSTNYKINIGNGHLLCGPTQRCESGDGNCQAVAVKTLDKVLADVAPTSVDVMKMDVETYECHVLAGGDTLFSRYHPKLLQVETAFLNTSKCVHAKAEEYGYREKVLGGDTSLILDAMKTPPSKQVDLPTFLPSPPPLASSQDLFVDTANCIPPGMQIARVSAGFDMAVFERKDVVSADILSSKKWEIAVADDMATKVGTFLPETGTFLDIGANIGYCTLLFAHRGFNVIAVEAMTRNQQAINASLCLNPQLRDRVTLVPTALVAPWEVGTKTCIVKSAVERSSAGDLVCGVLCEFGDPNCQVVTAQTLDYVLSRLAVAEVQLAKIDVAGHECEVLEGGQSIFDYSPHIVQVETARSAVKKCVLTHAIKHGYRAARVGTALSLVAPQTTPTAIGIEPG